MDKHGDESYDFGEHDERQAPTKADKRIEEDLNSRLTMMHTLMLLILKLPSIKVSSSQWNCSR